MTAKTPEQMAAEAEAQTRRDENNEAVLGTAEDGLSEHGSEPARQGQSRDADPEDSGLTRREPIPRSPSDDIRSQIASRFRRNEPEDERPFNGDLNDPENIYGELGQAPNDDEIDSPEEIAALTGQQPSRKPAAEAEPRMITRMVRGKPVTLSEDEWLDRAAQVTAADSYLEEARGILEQAKEIRAGRASPDRHHPDGTNGTQTDELGNDPPELSPQHPETSFKEVVEKIQFGDPEEAADLLERIVDQRAGKKATESALERVVSQDLARSKQALTAFATANPDLANDRIAAMAIEQGMYDLYKEDMLKLGLAETQLPKNPAELANWHRFYRVNGYEVRNTVDLLNTSRDNFLKWRGGPTPARQNQPSRQAPPRVAVNVDRDARRMAIPVQPSLTVTPRRDVQTPRQQTGSDVVAAMRRSRGQI